MLQLKLLRCRNVKKILFSIDRLLMANSTPIHNTASSLSNALLKAAGINLVQYRHFSALPNHLVVALPALSPTMEVGSIAQWKKNVGDKFSAGEGLCDIETDKATVSFDSVEDGYIAKILVQAKSGEHKVGAPILVTVSNAADVAAFKDFILPSSTKPAAEPSPSKAAPTPPPVIKPIAQAQSPTSPVMTSSGRVIASPYAKTLAREMNIDLSRANISGSGPGGRIVAADVLSMPLSSSSQSRSAQDTQTIIDDLSLRSIFARSKQSVPHFYLSMEIIVSPLVAFRGRYPHISIMDVMLLASSRCMKSVPAVNSAWIDDVNGQSVIRRFHQVDINVSTGNLSNDNYSMPLIAGVDGMGLEGVSRATKAIEVKTASNNGWSNDEARIGTFSVVNLGMFGVKSASLPILTPQACVLSLGCIEEKQMKDKKAHVMTVTLSCDHRVVDGAVGAEWLALFKKVVEDPISMLL